MRRTPATVLVACLALASCSTEVLGNLSSTTTSSVVTTTTIPSGDAPTILRGMLSSADGLGELVVQGRKNDARRRLQDIEAALVGVRPLLGALKNDVDEDVERIVGMFRNAVNKKRPADADKASRFLTLVIDAL